MTARYTASDVRFVSSQVAWQTARADCLSRGEDLISISNSAEQDVVMSVCQSNGGCNGNIWIGLNDFTVEHQWDWPDSCSSNPFTNWSPGEPNNHGNEDCVEMYPSGTWNDFYCTTPRQYMCVDAERGCPSPSPTQAPTTTKQPTVERLTGCVCWGRVDLLTCPITEDLFGGDPSLGQYGLVNGASLLYKVLFILFLRRAVGCSPIDLGRAPFLCFNYVKTTTAISLVVNLLLTIIVYLTRCNVYVWAPFYFLWLHIDLVTHVADAIMNRKRKAPEVVAPPRSNLELFAYTNNKKGWKEKAYNTMELRQAKKASKKMPKRSSKDKAIDDRRKSGMKQKGFSIKGAGIV